MFYSDELNDPKNDLRKVWIAGTINHRKIPKHLSSKSLISINLVSICDELISKTDIYSIRKYAILLYGVFRIYQYQVGELYKEGMKMKTEFQTFSFSKAKHLNRQIDLDCQVDFNNITLKDTKDFYEIESKRVDLLINGKIREGLDWEVGERMRAFATREEITLQEEPVHEMMRAGREDREISPLEALRFYPGQEASFGFDDLGNIIDIPFLPEEYPSRPPSFEPSPLIPLSIPSIPSEHFPFPRTSQILEGLSLTEMQTKKRKYSQFDPLTSIPPQKFFRSEEIISLDTLTQFRNVEDQHLRKEVKRVALDLVSEAGYPYFIEPYNEMMINEITKIIKEPKILEDKEVPMIERLEQEPFEHILEEGFPDVEMMRGGIEPQMISPVSGISYQLPWNFELLPFGFSPGVSTPEQIGSEGSLPPLQLDVSRLRQSTKIKIPSNLINQFEFKDLAQQKTIQHNEHGIPYLEFEEREVGLTSDVLNCLHYIKDAIDRIHPQPEIPGLDRSTTFQQLFPAGSISPAIAARAFYNVLSLKSKIFSLVEQSRPYSDIKIQPNIL